MPAGLTREIPAVSSYAPSLHGFRLCYSLAYDHLQSEWMFNALLSTRVMHRAAGRLYFHRCIR